MTTRSIAKTKSAKTTKPQPADDQGSTAKAPTGDGSTDNTVGEAAQSAGDDKMAGTVVENVSASKTGERAADTPSAGDDQSDLAASNDTAARDVGAGDVAELIDVLVVTGPANGARRAGLRFGPEPIVLPIAILREDEIESIENDKRLVTLREQRAASEI